MVTFQSPLRAMDEKYKDTATRIFQPYGLKVVTAKRYLGGFIGKESELAEFLAKKIENWRAKVLALTEAYDACPHEAYSVLTK